MFEFMQTRRKHKGIYFSYMYERREPIRLWQCRKSLSCGCDCDRGAADGQEADVSWAVAAAASVE